MASVYLVRRSCRRFWTTEPSPLSILAAARQHFPWAESTRRAGDARSWRTNEPSAPPSGGKTRAAHLEDLHLEQCPRNPHPNLLKRRWLRCSVSILLAVGTAHASLARG